MVVELKVLVNFCCWVIGCPLCILPLSRGPHKQCAVGVSYAALRYSSANIYPLRVLYPFGFFL